jgi:hypothetical protein
MQNQTSVNGIRLIVAPGMALDVLLLAQDPLSVRFSADCCDEEVELCSQFAHHMENRACDLVDCSWFWPLAIVIRKSAIVILS